jgi:hypothetical protein
MAGVAEQGTAPRAVHHDIVGLAREGGGIRGQHRARLVALARVIMQRAATALPRHLEDAIAVGFQGPPRRVVDMAEQSVHDATAEQGDRWADAAVRQMVRAARCLGDLPHCRMAAAPSPRACPWRTRAARRLRAEPGVRCRAASAPPSTGTPARGAPEHAEHQPGGGGEPVGAGEPLAGRL